MLRPLSISVLLLLAIAAGVCPASAAGRMARVAVFPVENLSRRSVPADLLREVLKERLEAAGIDVLGDAALESFFVRHRVRFVAGIDGATARALKEETGVDGVVIVSVELSSDIVPPKIGLLARLISVSGDPVVVWGDDAGLAGDEAPGLLDLHVVNDYETLLRRAIDRVTTSLVEYVQTGSHDTSAKQAGKFRPRVAYQGVRLDAGKVYSIAVLPFFNTSDRRNAGEILAALFIRHLSGMPAFRVIDTGEIRQQLLNARVIMDGGVSITDADIIATVLDADFVLGGRVLYYRDYEGAESNPRVDFSTMIIDRRTRKVVWSSQSSNDGRDGVRFFGRGRSATAHVMATQMTKWTTDLIAEPR